MDQDPAAASALQTGQDAAHRPHSGFFTAAVDDALGRAGAVPSKQTSLAPGPHTQLPPDQAAPAVRSAVAQAADRPVDHHTHPASPAAPDAAQLSVSLKPDSTEQPDTSMEPVPLCSGKNNATAAAATDDQQEPLPVSALRQHSRKRPAETASASTASQAGAASPAPDRSHGAGKQKKRRKPAPSFPPGAEAGDVMAGVMAVQHQTPALEACKEQNIHLACGNQEKPDLGSPLAGNFLLEDLPVPTPSAHRPSPDKAAHAGFMAAEDSVPISPPVVLTESTDTSKKQSKRKRKHTSLGAARGKVTHRGSSA